MTPIRRFLIALVLFGASFYLLGSVVLDVDRADAAGKTVLVKCAYPIPKVPYPHYKRTRIGCVHPGFWVRLPRKTAIAIGTAPIRYAAAYDHRPRSVCVKRPPKVSRKVGQREGISAWVPRAPWCVRQGIA